VRRPADSATSSSGFADAHKEGAEAPDLLLHGFFDDARVTDQALSGSSFLFLGYKGSGKTAIAERARLLGDRDPELFVTTVALMTSRMATSGHWPEAGNPESRYPTVWTWVLLLLFLVQSLERDEQGRVDAPRTYTVRCVRCGRQLSSSRPRAGTCCSSMAWTRS
jgi:hypothetical protein